jgi:hypothetical protein
MNENIFAYTAPPSEHASMPPYLSTNRQANGMIGITVRSSVELGSTTAYIELTEEQWLDFLRESNANAARKHKREVLDKKPEEPEVA